MQGRHVLFVLATAFLPLPAMADGQPLEGTKGKAYCIAFSPDGKTLAAYCDQDWTLKLWDTASGKLKQSWKPGNKLITAVAFSPDGKKLAVGGYGSKIYFGRVMVLDAESGKELWGRDSRDRADLGWYARLEFWHDGKTLAGLCGTTDVNLFDAQTGELKQKLEECTGSFSSALSPDGKLLASAGYYTVELWDGQTGKLERKLGEDKKSIFVAVAFAADGAEVVAVRWPNLLESWDARTGKAKRTLKIDDWAMDFTRDAVAFSPDCKQIATRKGKAVEVRDIQTGEKKQSLTAKTNIALIVYSRDGKMLAVAEEGGTITVWKLSK